MHLRRSAHHVLGLVLAALLVTLSASPAGADETGLVPYYDPPFAADCVVHQFGEGQVPKLGSYPGDTLCVEYAKRDITLSTGGAVQFLLAEPARVLLILGKCRYWQQDHWSVQLAPGQTPVIRWDGSYWYDLGAGRAGARLRGLTVLGQPATIATAAAYVTPYSPELAAAFLKYGQGGDGASVTAGFPFNPFCPR